MTTRKTRLPLPQPDTGYEVGYGKPPKHTRFAKGQSGNPGGRKKGSKNRSPGMKDERLKQIIIEEAYRDIRVREGERSITLPVIRAAVRTLANKGLKGETRSLDRLLELVGLIEGEKAAEQREVLKTMIEYKADWERELFRRKRHGITDLPDPIPHPDDIVVNVRTGEAKVFGPMTPEEKPEWELIRKRIRDLKDCVEAVEKRVCKNPDDDNLRQILADLREEYKERVAVFGPPRESSHQPAKTSRSRR